jgi:2-oxoglutarate dehydrogenase E2 component (dihydrolipoamide succinyltransferase)
MGFADIEKAIADWARPRMAADHGRYEGRHLHHLQRRRVRRADVDPDHQPAAVAVLGLHRIEDRPVVRDGEIVIRPMMYLALSYDHRLIDGREAVTALKTIKEAIEDPTRLLIDL